MSRFTHFIPAIALMLAASAAGSSFSTVWQLGSDDGNLTPFFQESWGSNITPGSATIKDDDYYLAGSYPTPIGTLLTDENIANFERAATENDPRKRIHFQLSANQASIHSRLRITVDLMGGGAWNGSSVPGYSTHNLQLRFNNITIATRNSITWDTTLVFTVPASSVSALTGANTLHIERIGGGAGGYIGFDFIKLEADPTALTDLDNDGMPRWFEDTYGLSDSSAADALFNTDGDAFSNLAEFQNGTNPTDPDSDNDGVIDSSEASLGTNPILADTDNDGITDGAETTTNPTLADTDGDSIPDNIEIEQGSNPSNASSKPFNFPRAIGLQFVCENESQAILPAGELAGYFRMPHWNASPLMPHWISSGTVLNGAKNSLKNHRGETTSAAASWSYHFAGDGLHKGPGNERMLNGMIRTQRTSSINTPVTLNLSSIPYPTYDIIVHLGYIYPGKRGVIRLDGNAATNRYFVSNSEPPFSGWKEITATAESSITPGNFVRFRNLSGSNRTITLESIDFDSVGIHGVQIIDSGTDTDADGMKDALEIEYRFNPSVADAAADADKDGVTNVAELAAGTDPHHSDSDRDGITDGAEITYGTSPLDPDSDNDTLIDGDEINFRPFPSSPILADSDADGFNDFVERSHASNPLSASSTPPPVPLWDEATRTWRWRIDNLRVLWNHDQSMLGAIQNNDSMLCEAIADIEQSGWSRQISIGIRYINGKFVHRFRGIEGVFYKSGTNPREGFWDSDWGSNPTDRTRDYGFSGYGNADDSKPLRFEFTATQANSSSNIWTLNFLIADLTNPLIPVTLSTKSWTNAVAAHASLLTGTTIWRNQQGVNGRPEFSTETGVRAFISSNALGTPDADSDGMPDTWETTYTFNTANPADAKLDADTDTLDNLHEFLAGTNPRDNDSDNDGALDGVELLHNSDPLSNTSLPSGFAFAGVIDDLDGDGISDSWLLWSGGKSRSPTADDDGDGMSNAEESRAGTDPDDSNSRFDLITSRSDDDLVLSWTNLPFKSQHLENSSSLNAWLPVTGLPPPSTAGSWKQQIIPAVFTTPNASTFYRAGVRSIDIDADGVEDWSERMVLGSSTNSTNSLGQSITRSNGQHLSGDALALLNRLQGSSPNGGPPGTTTPGTPSPVQAARFLMQSSFGPTLESIAEVRDLGYTGWINQQILQPISLLQPYIREKKADGAGSRTDPYYNFNESEKYLHGNNVTTPFARNAISGSDQLRQRVAYALSQILVVSRRDANLEEKPEAMTSYYDTLARHAFGNYGDLLREITFHPAMGWYLSSVGNQKADPSIPRYPDENYAREIMQLFTIGLWKLNPDGSRKTSAIGEPIPTYDNGDITELARVFTGMYFASPYGWGGGGWADEHFTLPMVMYPECHDFGIKRLPNGFVVPARDANESNGIQDVRDAVDALFHHPNTPPFVCRQLIQFLVTDNPSPGYIQRVQSVFVNDGSGVRGNMAAVIKSILLDPEAREAPLSPSFGKVREPVIRTMHLGRLFRVVDANPQFVWWNWTDNFYSFCLQEPMNSPSVFNFYTPVYQAPGVIREQGLVSPGFQIINTYSAVSFPNLLWDYMHDGMKSGWTWDFPFDYSRTLLLAENPQALVDHIDLLVCAGNLTARTRGILSTTLANPALSSKDRVALAVWTAMNSPEGVVQR